MVIAGDSRQFARSGFVRETEEQDPRAVHRTLLGGSSIENDAADDVLGHAAVDFVRELDEAEAVPELALEPATRDTEGSIGETVGRPRPGPGVNRMKPYGLVAAASIADQMSLTPRSRREHGEFVDERGCSRAGNVFSSSLVSSASPVDATGTILSTTLS